MAEKLGWPEQQVSWSELYEMADSQSGWAAEDMPEWGSFRFELTDPRYTTTGLQALLALDAAQEQQTPGGGRTLDLFRIQRALANIDASSTETLSRYIRADDPLRALSAMPLEEREVWRFNQTGSPSAVTSEASEAAASGSDASEPTAGEDLPDLVAVYPSGSGDIAMESDYPYVLLDTSWVSDDVLQFADEFGDYLISDTGVEMFTQAGFRTRDNEAGEVLASGDALQSMDAVAQEPPGDLPEIGEFQQLRNSWVTVPRVSRTLFLIDVSGSMQVLVPGTGQTRLEATVQAAKRNGQGGGDYRELEPIAPLSEIRGNRTHRRRLIRALNAIDPENDTALNDTVLAAYEQLRSSYTTGRRHLIVLLTDGRNDDDDSITHQQLIAQLARLHRSQEPIQVVSIAYGEQPDLDKLAEISETVGGRVVASPDLKNLERLFIRALGR
jgi:Ca-activated chloride channel family protein